MSSSSNKRKGVRFAEEEQEDEGPPLAKRARGETKQKKYVANVDELDDVDEWKEEEDDYNPEIASEKELVEAKRVRREKQHGVDDGGGTTHIDSTTSLTSEGIAIEPFHMDKERSDGTGYFDGDTYVFRKRDPNEVPDAWLESLEDNNNKDTTTSSSSSSTPYAVPKAKNPRPQEQKSTSRSLDDCTREELYKMMLPLVSDTETVGQAIRRYGKLLQQQRKNINKDSQAATPQRMAKESLEELTGASNALLLQGEVDVYETTRNDIMKKLHLPLARVKEAPCQWEYQGNQDGQIHGPYTTEQMLQWTKAGYFVGAQAVQIRWIRQTTKPLSTQEDLMADLMDDDDDDKANEKSKQIVEKGSWVSSNDVSFESYLP